MKLLKSIIYIFMISLVLSCAEEYDKEVFIQDTTPITGTIAVNTEIATPGYPVGVTVTLPQTFTKPAKVTVKAIGLDYTETTTVIDIAAGETSGSGSINMPAISLNGIFSPIANSASVEIAGLALYNEVDNEGTIELVVDTTDTTVMTSNIASVSYYERIQWPYSAGVVGTSMTGLLDWVNSDANDLDMYMIHVPSGTVVETAESGSRWETDIFRGSGNWPDAEYRVEIGVWSIADTEIDWKIFFVEGENSANHTIMEGTLSGLTAGTGANANVPIVSFTQTTDADGNLSYTYTKL